MEYASIRDALDIIAGLPTAFLAKADIADVFRLLPVHPDNHKLLGFKFKGQYYFDTCLPMGCAASCRILNVELIIKVLDDFLFITPNKLQCEKALGALQHLAAAIAFPLAAHKTVEPTTRLTFVGIEIDTIERQVKLPEEKLGKYRSIAKKVLTLRELKSLNR